MAEGSWESVDMRQPGGGAKERVYLLGFFGGFFCFLFWASFWFHGFGVDVETLTPYTVFSVVWIPGPLVFLVVLFIPHICPHLLELLYIHTRTHNSYSTTYRFFYLYTSSDFPITPLSFSFSHTLISCFFLSLYLYHFLIAYQ